MVKFTPENKEWSYEQITTANKNIQSYFMKSDQSYFVRDEHRFPAYSSEHTPIQIIIDDSNVYLGTKCIDSSIFSGGNFNLEKFSDRRECTDKLYKVLYSQDLGHRRQDLFVQLIFNDFMGRSDLLTVIDTLINNLGFKGIMVLPISLSISFAKCSAYCSFLYPNGFSFVCDFMLEDSFVINGKKQWLSVEDDDFAEEFSRLKSLDESQIYSCRQCDYKDDSEEKMKTHIQKEHKEGTFYVYEASQEYSKAYENRLNYLFPIEKAEKIKATIFSINKDYENAEVLQDYVELALKGASIFKELEIGKEIWMTDKEWNSARLRILKEKVLFFI